MNFTAKKILVELDALFDTVIGTLGAISPQNAVRLMMTPQYTYRMSDQFEGFDQQEFLQRYQTRDRAIIKNSSVTRVMFHIHEFTQRVEAKTLNSPIEQDAIVVINTFPYELEDSELELIRSILKRKLPLNPEIQFVHLSLDKLNPFYINKNYQAVILYNFNDWLKVFISDESFLKYPCFQVRFIAPAILKTTEGLEKDMAVVDKFIEVMEFLAPMIDLMFVPVENFCSVLAYRKPKPSAPKDAEPEEPTENIPIPEFGPVPPSVRT